MLGPDAIKRTYLYCTVALAGAAVLVVEILGAKLLGPAFGTSHFVWTAQICVTLVALAGGYVMGGRLAPLEGSRPRRVFVLLAAAGGYLAWTPVLVWQLAPRAAQYGLPVGALVTSLGLYFVPLALLAATSPTLLGALQLHGEPAGSVAGRVSAISTLGSVGGTLLVSYLLVPHVAVSTSMLSTAFGLIGLALGSLFAWRSRVTLVSVLVACAVALVGSAWARRRETREWWSFETVTRQPSAYGDLRVLRERDSGTLVFANDYVWHDAYEPQSRLSGSLFSYVLYALATAYRPQAKRALVVGLGIGILPMQLARAGIHVDVVEIDPAVIPLAERYFDFDPNAVHLSVDDGRRALEATNAHYDLIILDAFLGDSTPTQLLTREAFAAAHARLSPGGVVLLNCFASLEPDQDFLAASLTKTLAAEFAHVRLRRSKSPNAFFAASDSPLVERPEPPALVHAWLGDEVAFTLGNEVEARPDTGIVLTDDFAPIDYYDARNRADFRAGLIRSVRYH